MNVFHLFLNEYNKKRRKLQVLDNSSEINQLLQTSNLGGGATVCISK